eukprot:9521990-Karenia_brevis.AAC.1
MATWMKKFQISWIACNGLGKPTTKSMDVNVTLTEIFGRCVTMTTLLKQPKALSMVGSKL